MDLNNPKYTQFQNNRTLFSNQLNISMQKMEIMPRADYKEGKCIMKILILYREYES